MMPGCSNNIRIKPNSLTKAKRNNVDSSHQESCYFNAYRIGKVVKATEKKGSDRYIYSLSIIYH